MKFAQRFFSYPSEHIVSTLCILMGFSMAVLMDKNLADDGIINNIFVIVGMVAGSYVVRDIFSVWTGVGGFKINLKELSSKKLISNIVIGVILFLGISLWRGQFDTSYYMRAIGFIFSVFQVALFSMCIHCYSEVSGRGSEKDHPN